MHVLSDLPVGAAVKGLSRSHFGEKFCAELAVFGSRIDAVGTGRKRSEHGAREGEVFIRRAADKPTFPKNGLASNLEKWTSPLRKLQHFRLACFISSAIFFDLPPFYLSPFLLQCS